MEELNSRLRPFQHLLKDVMPAIEQLSAGDAPTVALAYTMIGEKYMCKTLDPAVLALITYDSENLHRMAKALRTESRQAVEGVLFVATSMAAQISDVESLKPGMPMPPNAKKSLVVGMSDGVNTAYLVAEAKEDGSWGEFGLAHSDSVIRGRADQAQQEQAETNEAAIAFHPV